MISMTTYQALTEADLRRLGKTLRERRAEKGLALDVVAARAGVSRLTLLHLERGVSNSRLDTLQRVAEVLDGRIVFEPFPSPEDLGDVSG
jgi:transcriptional regulator with XRE-family HTH domain